MKLNRTASLHIRCNLLALSILAALCFTAHAQLSVEWLTQYGTTGGERGQGIAVDALGQSWVSGSTNGSLGGVNAGGSDMFLSRLSPSGNVDFSVQRGGAGRDTASAVALVGGIDVFIGGSTTTSILDGRTSIGATDSLAVRYDASGGWLGTTRYGSSKGSTIYALAGNANHLLTTGLTSGSFDGQPFAGSYDAHLSKRTPAGALLWTRFAGTSGSAGGGAAFDTLGNTYMAGNTFGSFPGFVNAGSDDIFATRYDADGNRTLVLQLGTSGADRANDVKVDGAGNIYLAGSTGGGLGGQSHNGGDDAFVMKLDSGGNLLWTRLLGGSSNEIALALDLDAAGNVWVGGTGDGALGGHANAGGQDAFVAQYDTAGMLLGTAFFATSENDRISGLSVGPDGAAYVTGYTAGTLGASSTGSEDIFVARISGVPEPTTAILLLAGLGSVVARRRRRRQSRGTVRIASPLTDRLR